MSSISRAPARLARARAHIAQIRCALCGRRVPRGRSTCPDHLPDGPPTVREASLREVAEDAALFAGYRIVRRVGKGGFGVVFEAEAPGGGRVAIKMARVDEPQASARLEREIRVLTEIGPPHVPAVFDMGKVDRGPLYFVMEFVSGPTLADRLAEAAGPMTLSEVAPLALTMLRALESVHKRGYIHGDLKPENILIDDSARVKLIDFGLSAAVGAGRDEEATTSGARAGTAEYMSPEQCDGRGDIDVRSDIYAAGAILFEMLAARPPFWGPSVVVQQSHRGERPPRLSTLIPLPSAVEEVVMACLSKDRRDRFDSAASAEEALSAALSARSSEPFCVLGARRRLNTPSEAGPPSSSARERRRVALVFFESHAETKAVHRRVLHLGGQLAHAAGARCVSIYSHEVGENPARRALRAAQDLLKHGLCDRALVDLAPVLIQTRPDGSRRFISPVFLRPDRFPSAAEPPGVLLTAAAAAVLPGVEGAVLPRQGWIQLGCGDSAESAGAPGLGAPEAAPLVGREPLLVELLESARQATAQRRPCVARVLGDEGYGKSRLARELVARLRAEQPAAAILHLQAREPVAEGTDPAVRGLLRQAFDLPLERPSDGGQALLCERLGAPEGSDSWAVIALALGWIDRDAPALRAPSAAPGALKAALIVAASDALTRLAATAPLLIVLDDAHLADEATLGALERAAIDGARAPIWICALAMPAFGEARASFGERASEQVRRRLEPLDAASAAVLCRRLLLPAEDVPGAAVERLVGWALAVPGPLIELLRALKREGIVRRAGGESSYYLATDELDRVADLPLIEWTAYREIDALTPALHAHALLLSLLGPATTSADVEEVLKRFDEQGAAEGITLDANVGTQRLLAVGVLVRDAEGRAVFRRALVRDVLARSAPAPLKRRIHLAALEHFRGAAGMSEAERLAHLAQHAAGAGEAAEAARAYVTLADRARAAHLYMDAELLYSRAVQLSSDALLEAHRGRGLMRYRLGRYDDAIADFTRARELARARGDTASMLEILLDEATALDWMGEYASSTERAEHAQRLADEHSSPALSARLLLSIGRSAHRASRDNEAAALLRQASERAASLGDEGYETRVISLILLGFILQHLGSLDEAARALDRAIALCDEHGDLLHLGPAVANRALLRGLRGDAEGMSADYARLLALGRELGQRAFEVVGHYNLGEHLYWMGDLDAAEPHVKRALQADARGKGGEPRPVVMLLDARVRLYRGDEAGARAIARTSRERDARARAEGQEDAALSPSEDVLCAMVELATEGGSEAAWDELTARSSQRSIGQEHIEVLEMRGVAALRRRRVDEARGRLEEALDVASTIPNIIKGRLSRRLAEALASVRSTDRTVDQEREAAAPLR